MAEVCPVPIPTLQTAPAKHNSCYIIAFKEINPCSHKQEKIPREGRFLYQMTGLIILSNEKMGRTRCFY